MSIGMGLGLGRNGGAIQATLPGGEEVVLPEVYLDDQFLTPSTALADPRQAEPGPGETRRWEWPGTPKVEEITAEGRYRIRNEGNSAFYKQLGRQDPTQRTLGTGQVVMATLYMEDVTNPGVWLGWATENGADYIDALGAVCYIKFRSGLDGCKLGFTSGRRSEIFPEASTPQEYYAYYDVVGDDEPIRVAAEFAEQDLVLWAQGGIFSQYLDAEIGSSTWYPFMRVPHEQSGASDLYATVATWRKQQRLDVDDFKVQERLGTDDKYQLLDFGVEDYGTHVPALLELNAGEGPTGADLIAIWQRGENHSTPDLEIRASLRIDGRWRRAETILSSSSPDIGHQAGTISRVGEKIWLEYFSNSTEGLSGDLNPADPGAGRGYIKNRILEVDREGNISVGPPRPFEGMAYYDDRSLLITPAYTIEGGSYDGRIIQPVQHTGGTSYVGYSDDEGETWTPVEVPDVGIAFVEPVVTQEPDGTLVIYARTDQSYVYRSESPDGGESWTDPQPTEIPDVYTRSMVVRLSDGRNLVAGNDYNGSDFPRRRHMTLWVVGNGASIEAKKEVHDWGEHRRSSQGDYLILQYPYPFVNERRSEVEIVYSESSEFKKGDSAQKFASIRSMKVDILELL